MFEHLLLEGAQAGLAWITILRKRENYRRAFHGFDANRIAAYGAEDVLRLLGDAGIVRNRLKVAAFIQNAKAYLALCAELGGLDAYLWRFVDGQPVRNRRRTMADVPPRTELSDALSKDLAKRGFKFVGSTIVYAYLQAIGMVDDHLESCFRHAAR